MRFTTITPEEFRAYAKTSSYASFMQTPEIAKYRQKNGWTPHFLAVVEDREEQILAAGLFVSKPTFLGKSLFYAPGGPLLDLENTELTDFFFQNLIVYAKSHGAYALRIDPYYELRERDRDGLPVEDGFYHQKALKNLQNLGFHALEDTSMPKYLFARDLTEASSNLSPDALFASFKQNTRNLIHRAERQGVTIRELKREELPILKQITASTADRRHFADQPLSYYEEMYDLFSPRGEVKFLLAEVPAPDSKLPLSVAMFMLVGSEVLYLYSGSAAEHMKTYNAQYLIQWHMLKYATEHGFRRHNFYGLRGLPTDPKAPGYGIYRFKKGFGGQVIELIGTFELPIRPWLYRLHSLLAKVRH